MSEEESGLKRRRFPRLVTPIYYRPLDIFATDQQASNISLGGIRIYSNKPLKEKQLLEIELTLPNGKTVPALARVVWINALPLGSKALYDVGLEFTKLSPEGLQELRVLLDKALVDE
jgi:hypothetical protein